MPDAQRPPDPTAEPLLCPPAPHELLALAEEVAALHRSLERLAQADHLERLLKLIARPGWTTPAEYELLRGGVAHMQMHVRALHDAQAALLRGAQLVGGRS
ncbi:hypothetical protein [Deinococcus arcticus]|uniref:Uncharacterized protein n=1 Tax=Deinococcus arcticus TaxID=2136176 RepID=A0A2T3W600_9DEIO|nr:hypothetical protein [Deinococcus arcticus]PTA67292.1 hypothetical protein C8263_13370 [Deinococcus arcticus]